MLAFNGIYQTFVNIDISLTGVHVMGSLGEDVRMRAVLITVVVLTSTRHPIRTMRVFGASVTHSVEGE